MVILLYSVLFRVPVIDHLLADGERKNNLHERCETTSNAVMKTHYNEISSV